MFGTESDCIVSDWSDWSKCSIDCGMSSEGTQSRTRQILKQHTGGQECPKDLEEIRACVDLLPCRRSIIPVNVA